MDAVGGHTAGVTKEYSRRVREWQQYCHGIQWDPDVFSWDVFELFVGSLLELGATEEKCVKYQSALNDHFSGLPGTKRRRPLLKENGPITKIMRKYELVQLKRATDKVLSSKRAVVAKHSFLESWFSPSALQYVVNIATKGSAIDSSDAAEILVMILFGLRVTSTDGWDIYFNREGGIEVALGDMTGGGQLKTNKRVQFAGLQHRSAPFPADPAHPRAVWLRAIQRGMSFRSLRVARGTADAGRITANIRRLLPSDLLRLPSARYVSAKSCRKTMASAANAAGVPLRAIQQHGLWGEKSETAARNYIDRSYPIQPYTALVFDFLLDVGQAAVIMAI
jgi:hypothetical protein